MLGDWRSVITGKSKLKDTDKVKIIESVLPKYTETGSSYQREKEKLLAALEQQGGNRANIPTIDYSPANLEDIANAVIRQKDINNIPDGMRLLRNKKTGEVKLVRQ